MEVQAERMTAEDYALLAGRLRARSRAEGGLAGLDRLAERYATLGRAMLDGRAAGGGTPVTSPAAAANDNQPQVARQARR